MSFAPRPNYSKEQINRAGKLACKSKIGSNDYESAVKVINEWRVAHEYPMHTINMTLRRKAKSISSEAIIARRLKRLPTIIDKIGRREVSMSLSRMQDVGGVRAILPEVAQVRELQRLYIDKGRFSHIVRSHHDHITSPKKSGYRGIHIVFEFNNTQGRSSNSRDYDGLNIEIQLRTQLQHEWATAVETVGTILRQDLKSGHGDKKWLEFFRCMSSIIATIEHTPVVASHSKLHSQELFKMATKLIDQLDVFNKLAGWLAGMRYITEGSGYYYHILMVNIDEKSTRVIGFEKSELAKANKELAKLEDFDATKKRLEPVLVAAGDMKKLQRAYPNYFLDIKDFLQLAQQVVETTKE